MNAFVAEKNLLEKVSDVIQKHGKGQENLIAILLEVQSIHPNNYVSIEIATHIAKEMGLHLSRVYDVISFYTALSEVPRGDHVIQVCESTTCFVTKYERIRDFLERELGIAMGETTSDNKFTLELSPCFGACDVSPAIKIGPKVYGNLDSDKVKNIINKYRGI